MFCNKTGIFVLPREFIFNTLVLNVLRQLDTDQKYKMLFIQSIILSNLNCLTYFIFPLNFWQSMLLEWLDTFTVMLCIGLTLVIISNSFERILSEVIVHVKNQQFFFRRSKQSFNYSFRFKFRRSSRLSSVHSQSEGEKHDMYSDDWTSHLLSFFNRILFYFELVIDLMSCVWKEYFLGDMLIANRTID